MSTNYNLARNRESGIPLCNNNHPGNVSRCTAWKAASLEVALTHHDLEPYEGDFAIWQPGLAPWPGFQGAWRGSGPHAPGAEGWLPRVERASPSSVVRLGLVPAPPPLAHGHMAGAAREGSTVPGLALQASPLGSGWSCARRGAQRSRCPAAITGSEGQWAPVRALSPAWRH